jgi:hypothetical protein
MTTGTDTLPDITRPEVGVVVVSQWEAASEAEQRACTDELMEARARTAPGGLPAASWLASCVS